MAAEAQQDSRPTLLLVRVLCTTALQLVAVTALATAGFIVRPPSRYVHHKHQESYGAKESCLLHRVTPCDIAKHRAAESKPLQVIWLGNARPSVGPI